MRKPVYRHPKFVIESKDFRIEKENKRLWLTLKIDEKLKESLLVILKNPSRATKDISDKTVFNVTNYVFNNRDKYKAFKEIGEIVILNLIPYYETYSELLAKSNINIIDPQNLKTIDELSSKNSKVLIAWGDHPKGLLKEYEEIKSKIFEILKTNKNNIFYVDKLSKKGNPKHGQIWGYDNNLIEYKF